MIHFHYFFTWKLYYFNAIVTAFLSERATRSSLRSTEQETEPGTNIRSKASRNTDWTTQTLPNPRTHPRRYGGYPGHDSGREEEDARKEDCYVLKNAYFLSMTKQSERITFNGA